MIKLCKFNSYQEEVSNYLTGRGLGHSIDECLGRCDLCHSGAFVQVGEDYITAENGAALIEKLNSML